jgi:flagellar hook assembly protein FlgD
MVWHNRLGRWLVLFLFASQLAAFAGGTREVPELTVETSGPQYFSPNGDDVQDDAVQEFTVRLFVKSDEGYVPEYGLRILGADGAVVREVVQQEKRDINWFVAMFRGYKAFTLEKILEWDGRDSEGNSVADGPYTVHIWVVDASDNRQEVELESFVVDTTKPNATVSATDTIFSPNEDNNMDVLKVDQQGSQEDLWQGSMLDKGGDSVKSFKWENSAPRGFDWDGLNDSGALSEDGVYRYELTSTDKAGNIGTYTLANISLDTTATPIHLLLGSSYFSPNADGVKDIVTLTLRAEETEGLMDWQVLVADDDGQIRRSYSGEKTLDEDIVFDGNDEAGQPLPEGTYQVSLSAEYENGNRPLKKDFLSLDVTPPTVTTTITNPSFSPNGDRVKDATSIRLWSSEQVTWQGKILDSLGNAVIQTGSEVTTALIVWDGTDQTGKALGEGAYTVDVVFTDLAGNTITPPEESLTIDVSAPDVSLAAESSAFSPDGDGLNDEIRVAVSASEAVEGFGQVLGPSGGEVKTFRISEQAMFFSWDGSDIVATQLPDGVYRIRADLADAAGNWVSPEALTVLKDTRPTTVTLSVPKGFSPNRDGIQDVLSIGVKASLPGGIQEWSLTIEDAVGRSVKSFSGRETLPTGVTWDGNVDGDRSGEGLYTAKIEAIYAKGNVSRGESESFLLDVSAPTVDLAATADPFAQTDAGIEGEAYISLRVDDVSDIEKWNLDIINSAGEIVRSYSGEGDPSDSIAWNGASETGDPVPPEEEFVLQVEVIDTYGNLRAFRHPLVIDILVVKKDDKLFLMVPNIIFGAYKHTLDSAGLEREQQNHASIKRVMEIFRKYSNYSVGLEAHALNIYRGDPEKEAEEEEILQPLTERRGETVRQALIKLGMDEETITSKAYGGKFPIAPVDDRSVRWKNRRVEFIMIRP